MTPDDVAKLNAKLDTLMYLSDDKNVIELASIVQQMLNEKLKTGSLGFNNEEQK